MNGTNINKIENNCSISDILICISILVSQHAAKSVKEWSIATQFKTMEVPHNQ